MTYCIGLKLDDGIVFASDTRTNAGMDNIASYRKMHVWDTLDDRRFVLLSAGNLAVTQAVVELLNEQIATSRDDTPTLATVANMMQAARLVGAASRAVRAADDTFSASFIFGGQVSGDAQRLFHIYREGNFIEIGGDTNYAQIGEFKYGKPILDRIVASELTITQATKLVLLSFDSTLRSNLSVGMPIDLYLYRRDSLTGVQRRVTSDDPYFLTLSRGYAEALRTAFDTLPDFPDAP